GTLEFAALSEGEYEVRAYFDWPAGGYQVRSRYRFSVGAVVRVAEALARTRKSSYEPGEPIMVDYGGFPGAQGDWIAIVRPGDPDDTHGSWYYTAGRTAGSQEFPALPPGEYEVRAYFDWPAGGYNVRSRYRFRVGG
ncbi:MAG TPA: hypothetical protein VEW03_00720, partial [Longimicrobiaceae bacterium]|nr:hypothetical protein [Longimicrobiaceae bacterium]